MSSLSGDSASFDSRSEKNETGELLMTAEEGATNRTLDLILSHRRKSTLYNFDNANIETTTTTTTTMNSTTTASGSTAVIDSTQNSGGRSEEVSGSAVTLDAKSVKKWLLSDAFKDYCVSFLIEDQYGPHINCSRLLATTSRR